MTVTQLIQAGTVCGTCADEGERSCNCYALLSPPAIDDDGLTITDEETTMPATKIMIARYVGTPDRDYDNPEIIEVLEPADAIWDLFEITGQAPVTLTDGTKRDVTADEVMDIAAPGETLDPARRL